MAYTPTRAEFSQILKAYALEGMRDYGNLPLDIQAKISRKLAHRVVLNEPSITRWFNDFGLTPSPSRAALFPTPKPGKGIKAAFLGPRWENEKFHLDLLLWINNGSDGETIAFRFEPAHGKKQAHNYSHVQISRGIRNPAFSTSIPTWVPDSYPAFSNGCETPIEYFLSAVLALHGFCEQSPGDFALKVLNQSLASANLASLAPQIAGQIKELVA